MIDGEATVKTFRRAKGQIWLMPHNLAFTPIPGDDATGGAASTQAIMLARVEGWMQVAGS
jgi:SOS-response transcriptional repressor LexA